MAFFGFSQPQDPFAGLSGAPGAGDDDALEFEDTYAGQLDDADDALNYDTFGSGEATQQKVGRDFDFSGQTARMTGTLQEEQMLYTARQPPTRSNQPPKAEPSRTGYERYKDPGYIPALEANASIWGLPPTKSAESARQIELESGARASSRKMMSLEEVEAAMRAQSRGTPTTLPAHTESQLSQQQQQHQFFQQQMGQLPQFSQAGYHMQPQILQRPQQLPAQQLSRPSSQTQQFAPPIDYQHQQQQQQQQQAFGPSQPQVLQRQSRPGQQEPVARTPPIQPASGPRQQQQPRHILQNPQRLSGPGQPLAQLQQPSGPSEFPRGVPTGPTHGRGPSFTSVVTHPQQLLHLSEEERAAYLVEDAKRAKRNHKIHVLSKDNGLMTPQDKNFITRIQLQQLVTATGGVDEQGPEAALDEDFYYQVYSQIRGAPRQNPHQPANQFAQTYLFQTGGRYGANGRRHPRGGDNHMQRMEQQVQRAVEAAKAKPKNKQLVIEGSLGKISFSNSKTPKPLLNLKRPEGGEARLHGQGRRSSRDAGRTDRRQALRNIEAIFLTLMRLEDHERNMPPPLNETSEPATVQIHMEWQQKLNGLLSTLWQQLKVMEPVEPDAPTTHPFVAILSHAKGKKIIPRVFRHLDEQQRITIITMLVIQLDTLDVVSQAIPSIEDPYNLPRPVKEEIDLFAQTVIPPILAHVNDFPLQIILGLFSLILNRTTIPLITRTKVGLSLLTILISRAELLRQSSPDINPADWEEWTMYYNRLFDALEPCLPTLFTTAVNDAEDVYVWQFLAAMGVGASPEQQQRLVIGVKDRVMETVKISRALPQEMSSVRLGHVNLFMRAIGLDVELLG